MKIRLRSIFTVAIVCLTIPVHAQLFSDDFGTAFGSINTTNWPCKHASASSFTSSLGNCAGSGDYGVYLSGFGYYYSTSAITIPATGYTLDFEYAFNNTFSFPQIKVATSSLCSATFTTIATLTNTLGACNSESINLDAYSGQTIYIRFENRTSSTSFYFDEVVVDGGGGGGGCEFQEDFGTSFTSMFTNADWPCKHSSASSFNTSGGACGGGGDYSVALSGFGYYYSTKGISIPATGYTLDFNYAFNNTFSFPQIKVATSSSCSASFTTIATLTNTSGACNSESINLDAYSGQTIYIRFENRTSSASFYFDDVEVCGGGGSGSSCDLLSHDCTSTAGLNTSGMTANAGATRACTLADYVLYTSSSSSPYIATQDIAVAQGAGAKLEFDAKKYSGYSGTGEIWVHVGGYCSFTVYSVPFNTNGWVQIGTFSPTTSCTKLGPFTVPSDVVGGQKVSFCIVPRNASSTNWVSIDNICVSEVSGAVVPTTFDEDFGTSSSGWYPQSGYIDIPYHTYKSASDAYAYLFTGVDGGLDKAAYFYTGFDFCSTVSGVGIVTREINTSGHTNGQISMSFKSQYPCGGSVSYTFDEDYTTYSPEVYVMEGADHGSNSWVQLPVNFYFADYQWQRATYDISDYKNANIRIKIERGGFCSTQLEAVDDIKISDRDCAISKLSTGVISGPASVSPNTNYNYSVAAVTGATYYKWYVRNDGTLYDASPYIVSGQGTTSATVNFGSLPDPLRVLCLPFDSDPSSNEDACYAKIGYLTTTLAVCATYVWEGGTSSDWFTSSNWDCGNVPDESADVVIPDVSGASNRFPKIVGPAVAKAKDMDLQANASITVSSLNSGTLELYGDLTSNGSWSGTGTLSFEKTGLQSLSGDVTFGGIVAVQSGATLNTNNVLTIESDGSLLHGTGTSGGEGTVNGNINIKRNSGNISSIAYNYWCSPVVNQSVSVLGNNLYYYVPANAADLTELGLRQAWVTASGPMQAGKGYISTSGGEVTFSGVANNAPTGFDITITVEKVPALNGQYNPWNLVGNPFPCALDAAAFQTANSSVITGAMYFWEDDYSGGSGWLSAQDYSVYNVLGVVPRYDPSDQNAISFNGYVASGQSFFVEKISNGSASVSFSNSMRSGSNNDKFFRQGGMNKLWLGIINPNAVYNETLIAFGDDATDSLDLHLDAAKMKGNDELAFGTKLNDKFFAIQAFSTLTEDKAMPLALDVGAGGQHEIRLMNVENFDESISLVLEDRHNGTFQNLRHDGSYFFNSGPAKDIDRFYLHFNPPVEIRAFEEGCGGMDGLIALNQPGSKLWEMTLTDEAGQIITANAAFNGSLDIPGLPGGLYNAALTDEYGYEVGKEIPVGSREKVIPDFEVNEESMVSTPVHFQNQSAGADHYAWDFGDGVMLQDVEHPVHTYTIPGTYEVILLSSNRDCAGEVSKTIKVSDPSTGVAMQVKPDFSILALGNNLLITFDNWNSQTVSLQLFDKLGRQGFIAEVNTNDKAMLPAGDLASGFYFAHVVSPDFVATRKIFIGR